MRECPICHVILEDYEIPLSLIAGQLIPTCPECGTFM
jgi:predicted  nucleic acid-binding Zn-ribbon protein